MAGSTTITLTAAQMKALGEIAGGQHGSVAFTLETTNLHGGNVVAVVTKTKTWLVGHSGKVTEL
jgi:hypothetical protein